MIKVISITLSVILLTLIDFKIWSEFLKEKPNWKSKKSWCWIFFLIISSVFINLYVSSSLKLIITFSISLLTCSFCFNSNIRSKILAVFLSQLLLIFSEFVFVIVGYYLLSVDIETLAIQYTGVFLMNACVAIITSLTFKLICFFKLESKLFSLSEKIDVKFTIFILLVLMLVANLFIYSAYYQLSSIQFFFLNSATICIYIVLTCKFLEEQNKSILIKTEYESLLDKSVEYENIIDKNRRDVHENKNDLIILNGLISKRNSKAKRQIEAMLKDCDKVEKELKGNDQLYRLTLSIPSGGLRGLVYHKLLLCEQLKVNYDLRIGREVNSKVIKNIDFQTMRKFVKIVGIYLDNAIDAAKKLKNKEIDIEFFLEEGYFCVLISNTFSGMLDIEKMGTMGYTSKGGKHGYGLSLAKEILREEKNLVSETSIYKNIMSQIIKVKM
ncbi:MAG TPA: GHKL domain-containing protein [Candidatus Pelethosoma merdigallinarum]|nr:GHKL domain-containing protein [Candidatus Pelethosoma merdigallinarum]